MNVAIRLIVGTALLALALIASSWFLKDTAIGEWVDAALYIAIASYLVCHIGLAQGDTRCCHMNKEGCNRPLKL